jgi:hypothetical protein
MLVSIIRTNIIFFRVLKPDTLTPRAGGGPAPQEVSYEQAGIPTEELAGRSAAAAEALRFYRGYLADPPFSRDSPPAACTNGEMRMQWSRAGADWESLLAQLRVNLEQVSSGPTSTGAGSEQKP